MSEVMHDDASDVRQALAGQRDADAAFARLYDRHGAVVLSLCRSRTLSDAEDAMQETFIRAFRNLDQLDDPSRLRSWLYGIARNVCSERRRSAGRRAKHEHQAMNHAAHSMSGGSRLEDVAETSSQGDQLQQLSDAMTQLDDDERLAIHLHYLQDDPVAAAMSTMNLSRSGFYKLLARARTKLAALMSNPSPQAQRPTEKLV